jgi:hypothetical protein
MFFFTTNSLGKIDPAIVNRCHLVEMNQVATASAYIPLGNSILQGMGISSGVVTAATLIGLANKARGSLRDYTNDVMLEGLQNGGAHQARW